MGSLGGRMRHWRQLMLANPVAFTAMFTLGAFVAFTYSYIPLHTVNDRKVARLERSVLTQEDTIATLEHELRGLRAIAAHSPDEEVVASLESARDAAKREIAALRADLKTAKKRTRRLERERSDWKAQVAALEEEIAQTPNTHVVELHVEPGSPTATAANLDDSLALAAGEARAADEATDQPAALDETLKLESAPAAPAP